MPDGRAFVLDRLCTPEILGPSLVDPVRRLFEDLDGQTLAEYLIGGILKADLHPQHGPQPEVGHAQGRRLRPRPAAQPPVPAGQLVLDLRRGDHQPDGQAGPPARDRCTPGPSTASTRCSPARTSSPTTAARTATTSRPRIEGGDVHVIGHGAVLIGMGERTTPMAVEIGRPRPVRQRPGHQGGRHRAARTATPSCTSTP